MFIKRFLNSEDLLISVKDSLMFSNQVLRQELLSVAFQIISEEMHRYFHFVAYLILPFTVLIACLVLTV